MERSYITVVSGLPRSGTSMMMRVIGEGGIPMLIDDLRPADESNPHGYFEYEPVKSTRDDPAWVSGAVGKVVKMVHLLLLDLPLTQEYRVVFMRRDLSEVVRSQDKMLQGMQQQVGDLPGERLAALYRVQIQRVLEYVNSNSGNFRLLEIDYNGMVRNPLLFIERVSEFLDGIDVARAAQAVDPLLYRNRADCQ